MYCVVQTGSRMLRLECGTTRRTLSCAGAAQAKPASSTAMRRLRGMRKSSGETTPQVSTGMRESVRLPLAFFASGAAALLFEVLWFRALGRVLGNTVWAGALVLTAFMLGMALGGVLAARWAQRVRNPARAFACAEAVVAISGTLIVWGLPELEALIGAALALLVDHAGLLAVGLEVIWFRVRLLYTPGSDTAFALMLAVVLLGIALGGALAPLAARIGFAWVAAASAVAVVAGYVVAGPLLIPGPPELLR